MQFLRSIWTATKCAISWIFHIFIESPVRFEDANIQKLTFAISDFFRCNVPTDAPRSLFKPGETLLLDAFSGVFLPVWQIMYSRFCLRMQPCEDSKGTTDTYSRPQLKMR